MTGGAGESDADDRPVAPTEPVAAAFAVLAALVLGMAAVAASGLIADHVLRFVLAIGVATVGLVVARAARADHRRTRAFGRPVLRGAGSGLVVLGAYLLGNTLVGMLLPDRVTPDSLPSPYLVVLLAHGLPALAALAVAVTVSRAWTAGAGVLLPVVVALLMIVASAGPTEVSLAMLAVAAAGCAVALAAPARATWGDLAGATAGMAVTFAYGAGTSPLGVLAMVELGAPPAQLRPVGVPDADAQVAIVFGAVVVATVLVLVAVARRHLAGGLLAGSVFLMSTAAAYGGYLREDLLGTFALVPAVLAVVALVALRVPRVRSALAAVPAALRAHRPSGATAAAACAVVAATALVVLAVRGLPEWPVTGALIVLALLIAGALAYFLPAPTGAALAVVTLLAVAVAHPWARLARDVSPGTYALIELATAAAAALPLLFRHPRPSVFAAAAYLLLDTLSGMLAALLGVAGSQPSADPTGPVVVLLLPLLLVGLPAAVLALRGPHVAVGQALGALVLGMSAFLPLKLSHAALSDGALTVVLDPLTPTDSSHATYLLRGLGTPAALVALTLMVLALVLVASTARRPSAPLAAAAAVTLFGGLRLVTALVGSADELFTWCLVVAAVALVVAALAAARR